MTTEQTVQALAKRADSFTGTGIPDSNGEDGHTALTEYAAEVAERRIESIPTPPGHALAHGAMLKRERVRREGGEFRRVWG